MASVLKLYLRELPASVLTSELHLDFLRVLGAYQATHQKAFLLTIFQSSDLQDKRDQLASLNMLIHKLPEANFELVATLSRFLIDIVSNSEINKMTVRNGESTRDFLASSTANGYPQLASSSHPH